RARRSIVSVSLRPELAAAFGRTRRADRLRQGHQRALRGRAHVAVALEERALFDDDLGRHQRAVYLAAGKQLDALTRVDLATHAATDRHDAAVDLRVDLAGLPDDQRVVGDDFSAQAAVDAEGVAEAQLADELGSDVHEAVQVLDRQAFELHPMRFQDSTPRG